jgi:uncharacterized protein YbjT (DUF2867 family)
LALATRRTVTRTFSAVNRKEHRMSRTILITAATGQVSSALIDELHARGDVKLRAMVHDPGKGDALSSRGIEVVVGDLDDPRTFNGAFEGVDAVWAMAPMGPAAPAQNSNVIWAARQAGVRFAARLSAVNAAHDAPTRNGRLHALSDAELGDSGLQWTILKPHFYMQNLLGSAGSIAGQGEFHLTMGSGRLGMVDVRDVAAAAAAVLTAPEGHEGKTYTLTGPATVDFDEVAQALSAATGNDVRYVPVSPEDARGALEGFGLGVWMADALVEYGVAYTGGWGDFTTTAVADLTGRQPRSVADFARDHAGAFKG